MRWDTRRRREEVLLDSIDVNPGEAKVVEGNASRTQQSTPVIANKFEYNTKMTVVEEVKLSRSEIPARSVSLRYDQRRTRRVETHISIYSKITLGRRLARRVRHSVTTTTTTSHGSMYSLLSTDHAQRCSGPQDARDCSLEPEEGWDVYRWR